MTSTDTDDLAPPASFQPDRRQFLTIGGLLLVAGLAGCSTTRTSGSTGGTGGAGASQSAAGLVRTIRSGNGVGSLSPDRQLEQAALQQARYMASSGRMVHNTGWGKDFSSRVKGNGIEGAAAENIAEGRMDEKRLFDMWMKSPPHRRNLLDQRYSRFGLAYAGNGGKPGWRYWALVLAR